MGLIPSVAAWRQAVAKLDFFPIQIKKMVHDQVAFQMDI